MKAVHWDHSGCFLWTVQNSHWKGDSFSLFRQKSTQSDLIHSLYKVSCFSCWKWVSVFCISTYPCGKFQSQILHWPCFCCFPGNLKLTLLNLKFGCKKDYIYYLLCLHPVTFESILLLLWSLLLCRCNGLHKLLCPTLRNMVVSLAS